MRAADWRRLALLACLLIAPAISATALADDEGEQEPEPEIYKYFQQGEIRRAVLSPSGKYVAFLQHSRVMVGNEYYDYHQVMALHRRARVLDIDWSGEDMLVVQFRDTYSGQNWLYAIQVGQDGDSFGAQRNASHELGGYIFDTLPDEPEVIVFAKARSHGDGVATDLFRFNLFGKTYPQTKFKHRINKGADDLFWYLPDDDGRVVLGVAYSGEGAELWHRLNRRKGWQHVYTAPRDIEFRPKGISRDGRTLWALTNVASDKVAAVRFDLETATIVDTFYEHDKFDLEGIRFSPVTGEPSAVTYYDAGLLQFEYFNEEAERISRQLDTMFPEHGVVVIGTSHDNNIHLVHSSSAEDPGSIHLCDLTIPVCNLVKHTRPWLNDVTLATTEHLEVQSSDGLTIDAFLTLPPDAAGAVPLIAMPHGGPIGVSDDKYYSGHVQWLARSGYAVLQVNYRGSGGYGREFRSAGLREWGRGIEDDVEAAIYSALERYPQLDADRIGVFGSSYGGYSALMGAIRNPDLFRCAASFAGVTDLTLLFNRSDLRRSESLTQQLVRMIGDPDVDYDELTEHSPVYQYERIEVPIFIAHGDNDPIVDVEHAWRLKRLLDLVGYIPEFHIFEGVEHGFDYVDQVKAFYDPLIEFLEIYLKPGADQAASR
ncbi:MAG: prolyl oligopeptidase family serine peptidase [Woeseiaceae bacterium]|nr:prolyl oligopeptidase family serine peptidase [Woeseiaceae bacterium]